jgi:hypothetical protein
VRHARLSRGDLANYAGVAGDANPIHWDEDIAKLAGLPDVIAHGTLTMGLGAGFVSAWSGDPGAVTRYAVRLSQPAIVSATDAADEFSGRISRWIRRLAAVSSLSPRSLPDGRSSAWRR